MKLVTLAILAASGAILAAAPTLAQPGDYRDYGGRHERGRGEERGGYDLQGRIDWMQRRIDRGRDDGSLDRREAYRAQARLDDISRDVRRAERRNGGYLPPDQRAFLQARLDQLNDRLHWLRHNDERRPW